MNRVLVLLCLCFAPLSMAVESRKPIETLDYGCYNNDEKLNSVKFCHNCQNSGGNQVRWKFQLTCDSGDDAGAFEARLSCPKKVPDEGKQLRALMGQASSKRKERCDKKAMDKKEKEKKNQGSKKTTTTKTGSKR